GGERVAPGRRAVLAPVAGVVDDVDRAGHRDGRLRDGDLPVVAGGVPVELVLVRDGRVVADGVEGAGDGVAQLVDLLPGAPVVRAVGSADVDAHLGAVVVHPHPGRGAARAGGGEAAVAVDAVRARLGRVVEACVEAAGEPQTLPAAEVPVVRLGDLEGALRPDVDRDVQPVD